MKDVILYIAQSIDGYIARENGNIDWLHSFPNPDKIDHGYSDFYSGIDTIFMGRQTYETVLRFDLDWPYAQVDTYVFTNQPHLDIETPRTYLANSGLPGLVTDIRRREGKNIWLIGGRRLIKTFMDRDLIDEMIISVIPLAIGKGIPLFDDIQVETSWRTSDAINYSTGVVALHYHRNR